MQCGSYRWPPTARFPARMLNDAGRCHRVPSRRRMLNARASLPPSRTSACVVRVRRTWLAHCQTQSSQSHGVRHGPHELTTRNRARGMLAVVVTDRYSTLWLGTESAQRQTCTRLAFKARVCRRVRW